MTKTAGKIVARVIEGQAQAHSALHQPFESASDTFWHSHRFVIRLRL